jgi:tRNA(adenine34) deaminase
MEQRWVALVRFLVHAVIVIQPCIGLREPWFRSPRKWVRFNGELAVVDEKTRDDHFMQVALHQARRAGRNQEVPIGCIVVQIKREANESGAYRILGSAHNQVERLCDASAHAELLALRHAGQVTGNWRLSNPKETSTVTTLYCTCEPCLTCWSACHAFRVQRLVYGADDLRLGSRTVFGMAAACDTKRDPSSTVLHPFHNLSEIKGGVRKEECGDLLREFFRRRRRESSASQPKMQRGNAIPLLTRIRQRIASKF